MILPYFLDLESNEKITIFFKKELSREIDKNFPGNEKNGKRKTLIYTHKTIVIRTYFIVNYHSVF